MPPPAGRPAGQGRGDPFGPSWNFPKSGTRPKSAEIFIEFLLFVVGCKSVAILAQAFVGSCLHIMSHNSWQHQGRSQPQAALSTNQWSHNSVTRRSGREASSEQRPSGQPQAASSTDQWSHNSVSLQHPSGQPQAASSTDQWSQNSLSLQHPSGQPQAALFTQELAGECGSILEDEIGQPAYTGQPACDMWQVYARASHSRAASTQPPQRTDRQLAADDTRFRIKHATAVIRWEKKDGMIVPAVYFDASCDEPAPRFADDREPAWETPVSFIRWEKQNSVITPAIYLEYDEPAPRFADDNEPATGGAQPAAGGAHPDPPPIAAALHQYMNDDSQLKPPFDLCAYLATFSRADLISLPQISDRAEPVPHTLTPLHSQPQAARQQRRQPPLAGADASTADGPPATGGTPVAVVSGGPITRAPPVWPAVEQLPIETQLVIFRFAYGATGYLGPPEDPERWLVVNRSVLLLALLDGDDIEFLPPFLLNAPKGTWLRPPHMSAKRAAEPATGGTTDPATAEPVALRARIGALRAAEPADRGATRYYAASGASQLSFTQEMEQATATVPRSTAVIRFAIRLASTQGQPATGGSQPQAAASLGQVLEGILD